ncbi:hypothetical protein N9T36_01010 [bacterium]|nr:hypothetical protein [bacterium]
MKYLKVLILFISFSILFQLTATSANAGPCTVTNGEYSEDEIKDGVGDTDCGTIPAKYEIIIYEAYLCTSAVTIPTTTAKADLSMCTKVFENTTGAAASVVQNEDIDIVGKSFRPPFGTYTHSYAKIDKKIAVTWSGKIDGVMKSSTSNNNDTGQFCGTKAGSGTFENGATHTNSIICGTSAITPGKFIETMNSFSDSAVETISPLIDNVPGNSGATIQGIITDTNGFASTGNSDSFRLEAAMKSSVPIIIDDSTRNLNVKFSLTDASHLSEEDDNDRLMISSGPFISIMTAE